MAIRVRMTPHLEQVQQAGGSGIRTVVENYFQSLPQFGIELVAPNATSYDVWAIHAGMSNNFAPNDPIVAHLHGLYWTADYDAMLWEHSANRDVIRTINHARLVTAPSQWVALNLARDLHRKPVVIPHGVHWPLWQGGEDQGYVLWNKNRDTDVCDPEAVNVLAQRRPQQRFLTTFAKDPLTPNIKVVGPQHPVVMREMVLGASVYLASVKETFGIGTLEAMAAGVPVLGFDYGGTADLVKHGYSGYLARPGDYDDLAQGLDYCLKYRKTLGRNASLSAKDYSWESACQQVAAVYEATVNLVIDERQRLEMVY